MKFELRKKADAKEPTVERLGVSVEDAAKMLSVSERTLRHLTATGQLACKKIGRRVIYSVEVLKAFLHEDNRKSSGQEGAMEQ